MTDWIEGYKLGFKEGVIALKTQLKEKCKMDNPLGLNIFLINETTIDEICKEITEAVYGECK